MSSPTDQGRTASSCGAVVAPSSTANDSAATTATASSSVKRRRTSSSGCFETTAQQEPPPHLESSNAPITSSSSSCSAACTATATASTTKDTGTQNANATANTTSTPSCSCTVDGLEHYMGFRTAKGNVLVPSEPPRDIFHYDDDDEVLDPNKITTNVHFKTGLNGRDLPPPATQTVERVIKLFEDPKPTDSAPFSRTSSGKAMKPSTVS